VVRRADLSLKREPYYCLIHPYLLQSIRDTVAPVLRGRAQARLSLRRRLHECGVLRPDEILRVGRYLGSAMSGPEKDQVKRAVKVWSAVGAALVALPLVFFLVVYGVLASSSFVDTATTQGVTQVVVRSGRPSLSFAFNIGARSFGDVLLETGLVYSSLPSDLQHSIARGELVGDREDAPRSIPYWLHRLWQPLPPVRRGALQLLAGDGAGGTLLQRAASSDATRRRATWALALLSGDSPATQAALLACIKDRRPEVRRMAVTEATRLRGTKEPRALGVLLLAIRDSDNQIRLAACKALSDLPVTETSLQLLGQGLADADLRVQQAALEQLRRAGKTHPVSVFETVRRAQVGQRQRSEAVDGALDQLLASVQQWSPQKVAGHLMHLVEVSSDSAVRVEALGRLRGLAHVLDAARVLTVVGRLVNSKDPRVRAAAIPLNARFGNPEEVEDQLVRLAHTPGREGPLMRRAAAAGLGLLQNRPGADRIKLLKRLLSDPDVSVRAAAMQSLVKIGAPGLREVVQGIKLGHRDVGLVALRAVCQDAEPDRHIATSILAAAWKVNRADLRGRALGCARKLAAANPRLSLWLGDQARLDKNPEVRRAAAEAVALAAHRYGVRVQNLVQSYLRQTDSTIVVALLEAMTQIHLPPTDWLFREVMRLIDHRDPKVRAATAALLVMVAPTPAKAAGALEALFADKDSGVVRAATAAAAGSTRLKGPAAARLDQPLARVVAQARSRDAIAALGLARRLGLSSPIQRAAVHPEPDVRAAAVALLARRSSPKQTLAVLESALRDPEQALRLAALDAIARESGRLGEPAVGLLVRSLGEPVRSVEWSTPVGVRSANASQLPVERWRAFEALGRVKGQQGVQEAVRVLRTVAHSRSEERRRLAIRALGSLAPRARQAAQALVEGALDPALDVRTEARAVLAEYLGRHTPMEELVDLLSSSVGSALQRHLACSALAWAGRIHGPDLLDKRLQSSVGADSPMVIRMSAALARALARRQDRPEEVVGWLFGW